MKISLAEPNNVVKLLLMMIAREILLFFQTLWSMRKLLLPLQRQDL